MVPERSVLFIFLFGASLCMNDVADIRKDYLRSKASVKKKRMLDHMDTTLEMIIEMHEIQSIQKD